MKHTKYLVFLSIIILITSCTIRESKKQDINIQTEELIGKWNQISKKNHSKDFSIVSIQYINDSVAMIQINDSIGQREITGKWEVGTEDKLADGLLKISIKSDIKISFHLTENNYQVLMMTLSKENDKMIMTSYKNKFEKE